MKEMEEIYTSCLSAIERSRKYLTGYDGIYGSGARGICIVKPGEVDLNVIKVDGFDKKLYLGKNVTLVELGINKDLDPWYSYPQLATQEAFIPVGAVLSHHSRPTTDKGREAIKEVVSKFTEEDKRQIANSMIYEAYKFLNVTPKHDATPKAKFKPLVRALCDLLPYGELWNENPDDIPALYQVTMDDVLVKLSPELGEMCELAVLGRAGKKDVDDEVLRQRAKKYITDRYDMDELKKSSDYVRSKMRPYPGKFREPIKLGDVDYD